MQINLFTIEEENFIWIFDTRSRGALINDIRDTLPNFIEPELREIAIGIIDKLTGMTDEEFSFCIFQPDYEVDETEE